ncbi:hypothetical protein [Achromobacter xylosoxidans]|uniref:hypothetical protein n=1 Tax=Alcaligenes xylosoxydans xylosoxydans TaxID=85698 RepID=UPI0038FC2F0B
MNHDDYPHDAMLFQRSMPKPNAVAEIQHRDGHPYPVMRCAYGTDGELLRAGTMLYTWNEANADMAKLLAKFLAAHETGEPVSMEVADAARDALGGLGFVIRSLKRM